MTRLAAALVTVALLSIAAQPALEARVSALEGQVAALKVQVAELQVTAPTPAITPSPTATAVPTPTPSPSPAPSQTAVPGWTLVFSEDFDTPFAEGQARTALGSRFYIYPTTIGELWSDTSKNGRYDPNIISAHDGLLDVFIRTSNGVHRVAAFGPVLPGGTTQLYGRYEVRFRAEAMHGYKGAWLLWPASEDWPRDGEIDFPEGDFDGLISAFMHRQDATSGADQDAFSTTARWTDWHIAVTEWTSTAVRFYLDGVLVGTSTSRIPNTPMRWTIQNETTLGGFVPADSVSGHVLVDYVRVWRVG